MFRDFVQARALTVWVTVLGSKKRWETIGQESLPLQLSPGHPAGVLSGVLFIRSTRVPGGG